MYTKITQFLIPNLVYIYMYIIYIRKRNASKHCTKTIELDYYLSVDYVA